MAKKKENTMTEQQMAEEFIANQNKFYELYPDCPKPEPIPCLNLILKREYAEEILCGRKKFEWREFSEYYVNRLCEMKFYDYCDAHQDDEVFNDMMQYATSVRDVEKVLFHDYNGEWFLEVEVLAVHDVFATLDNAKYFVDTFNCHDLDKEAAFCARKIANGTMAEGEETEFFALELGDVLNTNLDELPEDRKKMKRKK